jgi:hypothetical protein
MPRPNRVNPSLRSRARTLAATLTRARLTETTTESRQSGFALADWRFLAEASVALDDAASVDELQSVVLRLVVPKVADFCVLRIHAGLALALGSTPHEPSCSRSSGARRRGEMSCRGGIPRTVFR